MCGVFCSFDRKWELDYRWQIWLLEFVDGFGCRPWEAIVLGLFWNRVGFSGAVGEAFVHFLWSGISFDRKWEVGKAVGGLGLGMWEWIWLLLVDGSSHVIVGVLLWTCSCAFMGRVFEGHLMVDPDDTFSLVDRLRWAVEDLVDPCFLPTGIRVTFKTMRSRGTHD